MVALTFATFGSVLGGASSCTPATCNGPVYLEFPNSDCTGSPTYHELNVQFGVCDEGAVYENTGKGYLAYYHSQALCDPTASNATFEIEYFTWGACMPRLQISTRHGRSEFSAMATSFAFLVSVNDTVTPGRFDNQNLPAYSDNTETCESVDNCTLSSNDQPALAWTTYYDSYGTCENPGYSYMFRQQNFGVCMNFFNQTYVKTGCFNSKGSYITHYDDAACTNVIATFGIRNTCHSGHYDQHCNAPLTPIPGFETTPEPSSDSSSLHLSAILGLVSLMALSVAF